MKLGRWKSLLLLLVALGFSAPSLVSWRPLATLIPASGSSILLDQPMPSAALGHPLLVTLYIPAGVGSGTALPVIILLHGVHGQGSDWIDRGQIQQIADRLIADHRLPPTIIAMPSASTSWYVNSTDVGGPGNYETAIGTELPIWLSEKWHARHDRDGRAIAGYSMGGFGALHIAFQHPERWGAAGSLSGTFLTVVGRQAATPALNRLIIAGAFGTPFDKARLLAASPVTLAMTLRPQTAPTVFLGCGRHDQLHLGPETQSMVAELRGLGVPTSVEWTDGGHDWNTWRQLLPDALMFLSRNFERTDKVLASARGTSIYALTATAPTLGSARSSAIP